MKSRDIKKGQTLVAALGLATLMTLTVAAIGVSVMSDRHSTKVNTNRTTSTYALDSAEQIAQTILRDYMSKKFQAWASNNKTASKLSYFGNNATEAEAFFSDLVNIPIEKRVFTLANSFSSDEKGVQRSISPVKYVICYFDDKDNDYIKDSDEKSFEWKGFSDDPVKKKQTGGYEYAFTVYGYTQNGSTKSFQKKVSYSGSLSLTTGPESFADYALFTHVFKTPDGGDISMTSRSNFTGKVHTNGNYRFAGDTTKGGNAGTFKGKVTSFGTSVTWNNGGSPKVDNLSSQTDPTHPKNGTKDIPDFKSGFEAGASKIDLPPNDISQERATLGGDPSSTTAVGKDERNAALGTTGTTPPTGVYPAKSGTNMSGGIYVQGKVDSLKLGVNPSGNQVYDFMQGTSGQRVVVDTTNNKTTFQKLDSSGKTTGSVTTYTGVPNGSLYVTGSIDSISGPTRTKSSDPNTAAPAIASDTQLTITAKGDVKITGDIKYQSDPRVNSNAKNTLGIFSTGGDIILGSTSPSSVEIHSTLMASATNKSVYVENYSTASPKGDATILGGIIEYSYGAFGTFDSSTGTAKTGFGRNFIYDERLTYNPPPFFPTTNKLQEPYSSLKKLVWEEKNI